MPSPIASSLSAADVIRLLGLAPHPEGGHYRETFRDAATDGSGRAASTAIYFLLAAGEVSRWHRVDAAEGWHWHAGASLVLMIAEAGRRRWGPIWWAGSARRRWCRLAPGSRLPASAPGPSLAARLRPALNLLASSWPRWASSLGEHLGGRISDDGSRARALTRREESSHRPRFSPRQSASLWRF